LLTDRLNLNAAICLADNSHLLFVLSNVSC